MNNAAFADAAIVAYGHAGRKPAASADLRVAPDDAAGMKRPRVSTGSGDMAGACGSISARKFNHCQLHA